MPEGGDRLSARSRRATLTIAITAIALDSALLGLIAPLLPEVAERTGAGEGALGLALAGYAIPIIFVSIAIGRRVDRFGRRPFLLAGLALVAVGSALTAVSESLPLLIAGRAIQGVGSASSWIAALAIVSDLAPAGRKGQSIGFALAANSAGALAGPAFGGVLGEELGFAAPFLIVSGIGLATLLVGWFVLPRVEPAERRSEEAALKRLRGLLAVGVLPATLLAVGGAASLGAIDVVIPLDLDERFGLAASAIGLVFAGTILLDALAAPVAGAAGDRVGRRPVAVSGLLLLVVSGALLAALGGLGGAIAGLAVYGVAIGAIFAAAVPWLDESFEEFDRGLAYGGLNVIYAIGYTIGPIAAGWLLEFGSADAVYMVIAVIAAIGAGLTARAKLGPGPPLAPAQLSSAR